MRHRSLEGCATVPSSVPKTRHCTLDFLASKAQELAIGRGASAQCRCVAASRVATGSRVVASGPLLPFAGAGVDDCCAAGVVPRAGEGDSRSLPRSGHRHYDHLTGGDYLCR